MRYGFNYILLLLCVASLVNCTKTTTQPPIIIKDSIVIVDTVVERQVPIIGSVIYDSASGLFTCTALIDQNLPDSCSARWQINLKDGTSLAQGLFPNTLNYHDFTALSYGNTRGAAPILLGNGPQTIEFEFLLF